MRFSPAIDPTLIRLLARMDDGSEPIAPIWRELGRRARARNLLQPSYESVRRLVHAQRAARRPEYSRLKRGLILTVEAMWRSRPAVDILNDLITGDDLRWRLHEYQRRPRDTSSRARPRGAA
jgi:hypothetical protein